MNSATSQIYIVLMLAKIAVMFTAVYILSPLAIPEFHRKQDGFLDKLYINFIHSNFIIILVAHFLVLIRMYEIFSLICFSGVIYFLVYRILGYKPTDKYKEIKNKWMTRAYDYADGYISKDFVQNSVKTRLYDRIEQLRSFFLWSLQHPVAFWLPLVALLAAGYIRIKPALVHAAYTTSDSYVHLAWVKYLKHNDIYHDGVYPEGFHAIIASLARLTFIDGYWLIRFLGPLAALVLVLSVYYFTLRVTRSSSAALISIVAYGIISDPRFPSMIERQTAALPQEYAAIFILPGLYFLWLYIKEQDFYCLLLYAEALAIMGLVHSYAALYMTMWTVVMIAAALLLRFLALGPLLKIIGLSVGAGVISFIPLVVGLLTGHGFYTGATEFIAKSNTFGNEIINSGTLSLANLVDNNPFFWIAVTGAVLLIGSAVIIHQRQWALFAITISLSAVIMLLFHRADSLGMPQLTEPSRTGAFMSIVFAVLYGLTFYSLGKTLSFFAGFASQGWHRTARVASVIICLVITLMFTGYPPNLFFQEYDAAADNYIRIQRNFPTIGWTIVGPQEQYQQVLNHGWHYDLLKFVQDFNLEQARNPNFELPIPTADIFVFTEKRPLNSDSEVTAADAAMELEPPGPRLFEQYYVNPLQRRILQAKALAFMEAYSESHSGVNVFYEDENMKIFHIVHDPTNFIGAKS